MARRGIATVLQIQTRSTITIYQTMIVLCMRDMDIRPGGSVETYAHHEILTHADVIHIHMETTMYAPRVARHPDL